MGSNEEQVERRWMVTADSFRDEGTRNNGEAQHVGNINSTEWEKVIHENGNHDLGRCYDVSGAHILNGKRPRDPRVAEGGFKNCLGFSIHTPEEATQQSGLSPQNNKKEPIRAWQVYLRNRRCQKQMKMGSANDEYPAILTKPPIKGSQQQHNVDKDQDRSGNSDTNVHMEGPSTHNEAENANSGKDQWEEATSLWNMAKELGATCGSEQGKIIDKIRAMGERDRKEAERSENRNTTP